MPYRFLALGLLLSAPCAFAQDLTPACETELALSALPEHLRGGASVYVFEGDGYTVARQGEGPFTCIVERNHPLALIPQCLDREGADTILPALVWKSQQVMTGADPDAVRAEHARRLAAGDFDAPERPGVSYMVSAFNRIHVAERNDRIFVGPHVMYYAPGVGNDDIGGAHEHGLANRGLPFVLDQGPHGYMISYVEKPSDPTAVQAACAGQLAAFGFDSAVTADS